MTDLNEVCISGMLLRDPVVRRTKNDHDMCNLQVSVGRPEPSKAHDYLDVQCWDEVASRIAGEFHSGDKVMFKGRLRKTVFTGLDGQKHTLTQIIAEEAARCDGDMETYAALAAMREVPAETCA